MSDVRMTPDEAAKAMRCSAQFIRKGLQQGLFPWGYAVKISPDRWTYFINRVKFEQDLKGGTT